MAKIRILHVSDTHGHDMDLRHHNIDILIHSGDGLLRGELSEIAALNKVLDSAGAKHVVYVPGNHDRAFEIFPVARQQLNATVLINESVNIMGLNIYGSPFTPQFGYWSFMMDRSDMHKVWDNIPTGTDVLVTHGPRSGILDATGHGAVGCAKLGKAIDRVKPKLHCFGHIHGNAGVQTEGGTIYSNAAVVNDMLDVIAWPNVIELEV
jgi:Icc-related predicted phosphoesterase